MTKNPKIDIKHLCEMKNSYNCLWKNGIKHTI